MNLKTHSRLFFTARALKGCFIIGKLDAVALCINSRDLQILLRLLKPTHYMLIMTESYLAVTDKKKGHYFDNLEVKLDDHYNEHYNDNIKISEAAT